jgi:hypothetical protein
MDGIVQVDIEGGFQAGAFTLNTRNADAIKILNIMNTSVAIVLMYLMHQHFQAPLPLFRLSHL